MSWCKGIGESQLTCTFKAPLLPLAFPHTSQLALIPTAGGLTVQLTVMYSGTREDTLQYSISTSPSPLSRRQTGQQLLSVTDLTTPISGSAEVALGPGTYSVTVTVTNEHSFTTSVPKEVTIPGWHNMALCVCLSINFVFRVYVFAEDSTFNSLLRCISFANFTTTSSSRHSRLWQCGDCSHHWGGGAWLLLR